MHYSASASLATSGCSCPLSALLLRLVSVIDHSGRAMAQHDRHKLLARIMKRYFSAAAHRLWDTQRFLAAAALHEQLHAVSDCNSAGPPHFDCQCVEHQREWREK